MSESSEPVSLVDRYWQVGVILFGLLFVTVLVTYSPHL